MIVWTLYFKKERVICKSCSQRNEEYQRTMLPMGWSHDYPKPTSTKKQVDDSTYFLGNQLGGNDWWTTIILL